MSETKFHKRYKCKFTKEWYVTDWVYRWEVVGALGGAHLHIHPYTDIQGVVSYSAGLEAHFIRPPASRAGEAPNYLDCAVVKGWCWHDGTSMYASDHFVPLFVAKVDDEEIFQEIARWAADVFEDRYPLLSRR